MPKLKFPETQLRQLEEELMRVDPEVDHETFLDILEVIFIETFGSYHGLEILDFWYSQSSQYLGADAISNLWYAYIEPEARHFGIAKLAQYAQTDKSMPPANPMRGRPGAPKYRLH
jgi:hypothetical protein